MDKLRSHLDRLLKSAKFTLSEQQLQQLLLYIMLLDKWNTAYNLTSIRDRHEMLVKHLMDSLVVSPYLIGDTFIDVGTGAGLPGIPLAIINKDKHFTLLDSLGKKTRFLKQVNYELNLENINIVQERVENYSSYTGFDGVISRAFSSLHNMSVACQHLLKKHGFFYALKGIYPQNELSQLASDIALINSIQLDVPELLGERHLVILGKIKKTIDT